MSTAFLELRLKFTSLILYFPQTRNKHEIIGVIFVVVDNFEVGFILLIYILFGGVHVGIGQRAVLIDVVVCLVGYLKRRTGAFFNNENSPVVEGRTVPRDEDKFIADSKSS